MTIDFPHRHTKSILKQLIRAGLAAADPGRGIHNHCMRQGETLWVQQRRYDLTRYNRIVCIGAGKASVRMVKALRQLLAQRLASGIIVVKDLPQRPMQHIETFQAGHPTPDSRSTRAARALQQLLQSLTAQDLLIALISGGASSLVADPAEGLTLKDKQRTTQLLLRSGATIQEMNIVRKHLSAIKGGQLIASTSATVISLILSDVLGDNLDTIGSGLTAADSSTFLQAGHILEHYGLWKRVSSTVTRHIERGIDGIVQETLKPEDRRLKRIQNVLIGNNHLATREVARQAKLLGLRPVIQTNTLQGEARKAGIVIASLATRIHRNEHPIRRPACMIWGGEPTVTLTGKGKGGRAQECALSAAIGMAGLPNMVMAGLGTDGSDGPTDAAGAVVDGQTVMRARTRGLPAGKFLKSHNSYSFFQQAGGHIKTGPTGTNVNDMYFLLAL
ncbi:MAG: hydroxypyruvate reductase [Nitrospirales bacterium]|nr:MAG: hydroxypyruvate reductase [Nitrospirales bacterium]